VVGFTVQAVRSGFGRSPRSAVCCSSFQHGGRHAHRLRHLDLSAVLVGLARALRPRPGEAPTPKAAPARVRVRLRPALRRLLVADCLIRLCEGLPEVFLVLWAIEVVRVTPAQFGLLVSVLMATAIASYLPAAALGTASEEPFVVLTTSSSRSSRSPSSPAVLRAPGPRLCHRGLREIGEPARKP
jgi:hypothetical protein